jgi:hypothetical protein
MCTECCRVDINHVIVHSGNHGELKLTLKNDSNIPADLVLDMRTDEEIETA